MLRPIASFFTAFALLDSSTHPSILHTVKNHEFGPHQNTYYTNNQLSTKHAIVDSKELSRGPKFTISDNEKSEGTIKNPASCRIRIDKEELVVDLAISPQAREKGLMNRTFLVEGTGMLFVYDHPQILSFWMKNTLIPLSIGFFDENRCLINIENMDPPKNGNLTLYKSKKPALFALEVPQGWFERHQIHPPMEFETIHEF